MELQKIYRDQNQSTSNKNRTRFLAWKISKNVLLFFHLNTMRERFCERENNNLKNL